MHFNLWTFLFQIINFLVLAYILHRLLYAPLRASIEERRKKISDQLSEAESARCDAENQRRELSGQLADMQRQREEILLKAHTEAEDQKKTILVEAAAAAPRHREEFEKGLEHDRTTMMDSLQREVIDQAVDVTRRLLAGAADRTLHQQLVRHLLESLQQVSPADRSEIRQHWRPMETVLLETSRELDPDELQDISRAASEITGLQSVPRVQIQSDLIEGVRLRMGGYVWDASLSGQLPDRPQSQEVRSAS